MGGGREDVGDNPSVMAAAAVVVESGIFGDLGEWEGKFGKETVAQGVGRGGGVREVVRKGGGGGSGARSGEGGGGSGGGHF